MNNFLRLWLLAAVVVFLLPSAMFSAGAPKISGFVPNQGQWPAEVRFVYPGSHLNVWITSTGVVLDQFATNDGERKGHVLRLTWDEANPIVAVQPTFSSKTAKVSFLNSLRAPKGAVSLPVASQLTVPNVWPGIDVIYYLDEQGQFRYDFDVKPGAKAQHLGFKVDGDEGMKIGSDEVTLKTSLGEINMSDLFAYVLGKKSLHTPATFTAASSSVRFSVPQWNGNVPLRVDPVVYGTYMGGSEDDKVCAVRTRGDEVIVAGTTTNLTFPTEVGAYKKNSSGQEEVFVAILTSDLSTVKAYTYYGGTGSDVAVDMVVGKDGSVAVVGTTDSDNIPTSNGAVGQLYKNKLDVFVARFSADLSTAIVSSYLGGNKDDIPHAIAIDNNGSIYVVGQTDSDQQFPTTLAHQAKFGGNLDAFIAKLAPNGGSYVFCTYYGKAGSEKFTCIALDAGGEPFVSGSTTSSDFETAPTPGRWSSGRVPYDRTYNGGNTDAFLIKFFSDGTLSKRDDGTFSSFFGGNNDEEGRAIFVDGVGRPVLVGVTTSTNLPTEGSQQVTPLGQQDIFMVVLAKDGRGLVSCTYYGGTGKDDVLGIIPGPDAASGYIYGVTNSADFPVKGAGTSNERVGTTDGFLAQINSATNIFATLVGGVGPDTVVAADVDARGDFYYSLAGPSPNLFISEKAWQKERSGGTDAYIGKFAMGTVNLAAPNGGESWCIGTRRTISWSQIDMTNEDRYDVLLSTNSGETWDTVAKNVINTNYSWDIANIEPGTQNKMRIVSKRGHLSESANFTLNAVPSIVEQPLPTSACEGEKVTLSVVAEGSDLRYQWKRAGANIPGANAATYTIESLSTATAGTYSVDVSGVCNPAAKSNEVTVLISIGPTVTKHPASATVEEGKPLTLTVEVASQNPTYQWYKDDVEIANATSATYSVPMARLSDAGSYVCEVKNACGMVRTIAATIKVDETVSVDEDGVKNSMFHIVGPNPASSEITVFVNGTLEFDGSVRVYNSLGELSLMHKLDGVYSGEARYSIPVHLLSSGQYTMEVSLGKETIRQAFIVAR